MSHSVAALVVFLATAVGPPVSASSTKDFATQVGYFTAPVVGDSVTWAVECEADDPSVTRPYAVATGVKDNNGAMSGSIFYNPRSSHKGKLVQVGDQQTTFEPRETRDPDGGSSLRVYGSESGGSPGTFYVVWALWGSTATCTGRVNGAAQPVHYLDGSHAFLVGPEAFSTGVYAQDGFRHASVGRTFITDLKRGSAFAELQIGEYGAGSLHYDNDVDYLRACRQPYGGVCGYENAAASKLTATTLGAYELGGSQGEMIVITLPPDA